jgi:hypothetical protein
MREIGGTSEASQLRWSSHLSTSRLSRISRPSRVTVHDAQGREFLLPCLLHM